MLARRRRFATSPKPVFELLKATVNTRDEVPLAPCLPFRVMRCRQHGATPLFIAAFFGNEDNVKALLELGGDSSITGSLGGKVARSVSAARSFVAG
jgi:hypothetical protein